MTPSGMEYDLLKLEDITVTDLDGNIIEGIRKQSSDLKTHLQIYKAKEEINGIIHTHSSFASCFAVLNESIPVTSTTMANEIGGEVPVSKYAPVGSDELGEYIVEKIGDQKVDMLLIFPENFETDVKAYDVLTAGKKAPQVEIYFNSASTESAALYGSVSDGMSAYESSFANKFDVNAGDGKYDLATKEDTSAKMFSLMVILIKVLLKFLLSLLNL